MDKHAYLIMAHGNFEELLILLTKLDDQRNNIYLHIDKKIKYIPIEVKNSIKEAKLLIFQEFSINWGGYSIVECEFFLLKNSLKDNNVYYHLLSGTDMPIKSQDYIHDFFEKNKGIELIEYISSDQLNDNRKLIRRIKYYHYFLDISFIKNFNIKIMANRVFILLQMLIGINRMGSKDFQYGSQWFSISHECAKHVISKSHFVYQKFKFTSCSDELFLQTLLYNTRFYPNIFFDENENKKSNLRLIKWEAGSSHPKNFTMKEIEDISSEDSKYLFIRKLKL